MMGWTTDAVLEIFFGDFDPKAFSYTQKFDPKAFSYTQNLDVF